MVQILLVHNEFDILDKLTYLSYAIRIGTCSKWNHVAIRIGDTVIEAIGKGVMKKPYEEWYTHANRQVLPLQVNNPRTAGINHVLLTVGSKYGFGDLVERFKEIKREKWDGKSEYHEKDKPGFICSDLGCILLGIPKDRVPGDFVSLPGLTPLPEYTTTKV